ncbi:MAG: hypothetical protein R3A79_14545 [Nannocystaceae bacterium]
MATHRVPAPLARAASAPLVLPLVVASLLGCSASAGGDADEAPREATYTWHRDVAPVIADACAGCHVEGNIAPFALTSYAEVSALAAILAPSIEAQSMPPWPPADDCNTYEHDRSLTAEQREMLLTWLDEGAPEGDPAEAAALPEPAPAWVPDVTVAMPEPYVPAIEPDDYRCFLLDTGELESLETTRYVTGFEVFPGERAVVHHVIAYLIDAEQVEAFEALDAADPEPGYTCFGGPNGTSGSGSGSGGARWLGSWVPGSRPWEAPEGSGIAVSPGVRLVVQMHYNTSSSAPLADRTSLGLRLEDDVERPGMMVPLTEIGWITGTSPMTIPAGEPSVVHSASIARGGLLLSTLLGRLGVGADETVEISSAGLHMHTLGRKASLAVRHADSSESCLLRIDDYDFGWQGGYSLRESVRFAADDTVELSCEWDNSAENQPVVDGAVRAPQDVEWGEGTFDEMCLAVIYVSR